MTYPVTIDDETFACLQESIKEQSDQDVSVIAETFDSMMKIAVELRDHPDEEVRKAAQRIAGEIMEYLADQDDPIANGWVDSRGRP